MASVATREPLFRRGSRVHAYWLANSEGFALGRGRVESVVREPEAATVDALVVRTPLRRRRVVDPDAVAAVDPVQRVLLVERRPRRRLPVRTTLGRARSGTAPYARAAAGATARGWAWTRPRAATALRLALALARAYAIRAGQELAATAAWLRPRLAEAATRSSAAARARAAALARERRRRRSRPGRRAPG